MSTKDEKVSLVFETLISEESMTEYLPVGKALMCY